MRSVAARALGLLLFFGSQANGSCPANEDGLLSIVIDDLGYRLDAGEAAVRLPAPVTLAVIPGTPYAQTLMAAATERDKEIIIHMPMAASHKAPGDPYTLLLDMSEREIELTLAQAFAELAGATGLNNHMGSALTADKSAMNTLMGELIKRDMFFIDSRTTENSLAMDVAREHGVPAVARSVFLDNDRDDTKIAEQLAIAVDIARREGRALAIGHPFPETLRVLDELLPQLPIALTIVPASQLARCQTR